MGDRVVEAESREALHALGKKGEHSEELRQKVESVFRRYRLKWELRTLADEEIAYDVQVPADMKTESISDTIAKLDPEGKIAIGWDEQKKKVA